jgi:hypothetical protein
MTRHTGFLCALPIVFLSALASAQSVPSNRTPAPTPAPAPATTSPAPVAAAVSDGGKFAADVQAPGPTTAPTPMPELVDRTNEGHLRGGLSLNMGFFAKPGAITIGPELRLGYQLNASFGLFAMAGAVAGLGVSGSSNASGSSASITGVSYTYLGVNAEALFGDKFIVGGGVAIGRGGWATAGIAASTVAGASSSSVEAGGLMPQGNLRLGLALGSLDRSTGRRSGLTLALDGRFLLAPDSVEIVTRTGITGSANTTTTSQTTALGFNPMLVLGVDWR